MEVLPRVDFDRVLAATRNLESNPRPPGCLRLEGRTSWRLRVGDYRVLYEINDDKRTVLILDVYHRREAYR
jgi:mRNA interferase RelE/StbE